MTAAYALAAATGMLVIALLAAERTRARWRGWVKAAASAGFIATALAAGATGSVYGAWVLAALCLGWMGDVALVSSRRPWFLAGLAAFLVSHLAYVGAFAAAGLHGVATVVAAAVLALPAVVVVRWLWPHLPGEMQPPVLAYVGAISAMVATAVGTAAGDGPLAAAPAALAFYLSDLSVARDRFVSSSFTNRLWGLPLYYGAQVVFALSVGWG